MPLIAGIAWQLFVGWLIVADPHPHLDKAHCWVQADPIVINARGDYLAAWHYCWPKRGCFIDAAGNAMCWSAKATLENRR